MSKTLTASDRAALIRLASAMPVGSDERRAILAGLNRTAAASGSGRVAISVKYKKMTDGNPPKPFFSVTFKGSGSTHETEVALGEDGNVGVMWASEDDEYLVALFAKDIANLCRKELKSVKKS